MQRTDDLNRPVRLGPLSVAKVMKTLLDGPSTVAELQDASGLSVSTLYEYLRALRKEGVVHVAGWEKDATGRESVRVFKLGPGKDVPRQRKSKAQIARECRQRKSVAKMLQLIAAPMSPSFPREQRVAAAMR